MNNLTQTIEEIKSLKIQGATNVAKAALKALLLVSDKEIPQAIEQLTSTRVTEPLMQNCLTLVKLKGKVVIKPTLARLDDIKEEIVKNGLALIKEGKTILTHCHSSTVVELLKQAKKKGINFKVYLTETRPAFQGRITAKELIEAGISATMITDSEAAFLVSQEDNRKIDLVLLGADAITPDGGAINKVGSYGIALSASEAKIPLFIATSLLKFSHKPIVIEERPAEEVWKDKPRDLMIFNPSFDLIPPELITSYVTEFGQVKPEEVRAIVKKNYPWIVKNSKFQVPSSKISSYMTYLHLGEKVDPRTHIIAEFLLGAEIGSDFEEVAGGVAAESSVGTWTEVTTQLKNIWDKLHARVIEADKKTSFLKIAYPLALFEKGNVPQLLSSVAGNIFGLKEIASLKLLDLILPEKYVQSFSGPALGIKGVRRLTGVFDRPLIGCIIKPKLGLDFKAHAKVAYEVFKGGVDFVKDDENLTNQTFNPFKERVEEVMKVCINVSKHLNKIYAFNVTGPTEIMLERAEFVKDSGGNCVMVDFLTAGFGGLQALRNKNYGLIIHGHRAMHAAFTRGNQGISMLVLAKLARLAGVDSLHTGTVVGKMEGGEEEIKKINQFLLSEWYGIKPVLPVASGGLYPGLVPNLIKILGKDVLLNFGGGIHGHPKGSKAGARAVTAAVEASQKGISLFKYSQANEDLAIALKHWGGFQREKNESTR